MTCHSEPHPTLSPFHTVQVPILQTPSGSELWAQGRIAPQPSSQRASKAQFQARPIVGHPHSPMPNLRHTVGEAMMQEYCQAVRCFWTEDLGECGLWREFVRQTSPDKQCHIE